jgi:hypothetical protein
MCFDPLTADMEAKVAIEFRILSVDTSDGTPGDSDVNLQSLRDAVLAHPSLALEALKYALGADQEIPSTTAGGFGGSLPPDTPIFKMLTPDQAALLSPAAMKLTKADLISLQGSDAGKQLLALHLTFDDLKTVEEAFHQRFGASGLEEVQAATDAASANMSSDISCCCCTPCCCCTAVSVTSPLVGVS